MLINSQDIKDYLKKLSLPAKSSHKGQNGKLLIIGGSELFHVASKWSADIASRFVDMLFYSSVPVNNRIIAKNKSLFWKGIVVPRDGLLSYVDEADCILIGPGMHREEFVEKTKKEWQDLELTQDQWNNSTALVVNKLLSIYDQKKWVIDAGALQLLDPRLLNKNCIITPHLGELDILYQRMLALAKQNSKINRSNQTQKIDENPKDLRKNIAYFIAKQTGALVLAKGSVDIICTDLSEKVFEMSGGSPGMTKGGSGDVLAGLVAGLYANNDILVSAIVASFVNKKAGEELHKKVGSFFDTDDLVLQIPKTFYKLLNDVGRF